MLKVVGKMKGTKANTVKSSANMSKNQGKEKEKGKVRKESKKNKKHKNSTNVGESQEDSDEQSRENSLIRPEDDNSKGKKISKECEDNVNTAVSELFDDAWKICVERFFISSAPLAVSVELRNTWLRIVEAEWQDPDMRENRSAGNNRIFKSDEPPLPSAFDSWSRGALEPLPRVKRESVMDPFLRDLLAVTEQSNLPSVTSSLAAVSGEINPENLPQDKGEKKASTDEVEPVPETAIEPKVVSEGEDEWNFDLDEEFPQNFQHDQHEPKTILAPPVSKVSSLLLADGDKLLPKKSEESEILGEQEQIHTLLPVKHQLLSDSTTEYDDPSLPRGEALKRSINAAKRFSPTQCGGRIGSGVFRLFHETTPEALLKRKQTGDNLELPIGSHIMEQKALNFQDIVKVTKKRQMGLNLEVEEDAEEEEEAVVQPLFEERTTRTAAESGSSRLGTIWGAPRSETLLKGGDLSVGLTASEENFESSRFLQRALVNLRERFKRQTIRVLAARAMETSEDAATTEHFRKSSYLTSEVSKTSFATNRTSKTSQMRQMSASGTSSRNGSEVNIPPVKTSSSYSFTNIIPEEQQWQPKTVDDSVSTRSKRKPSNPKNPKDNKVMANVRSSSGIGSLQQQPRNSVRRFQDSVIRTAGQVQAQARFENTRKHPCETDKSPTRQTVLAQTASVESIEGCDCRDTCAQSQRTIC